MSLDLFILLLFPMLFYGYKQSIWSNSRTTLIVIVSVSIIAISAKYLQFSTVLIEIYIFLMLMFIRAIFRERLKNVKSKFLKGFFYA